MKTPCAASDDQPRSDRSCDDASAASAARGTGSNSENSTRPAKNPPICACQATLPPSAPIAIDPTPKMMLTPNQTARKPSTRVLRSARISDSAGTRAAASASPRLNERKLPCTKAKRIAAAIVPAGALGSAQARKLFRAWPDFQVTMTKLRSLTQQYPGHFLAEEDDVPAYYLEGTVPGSRWSDTAYFSYVPPGAHQALTGAAALRAAIARHYFSLIILDYLATPGTDAEIIADVGRAGYQSPVDLPFSSGGYTIWTYRPRQPPEGQHGHR